MLLHEAVQSNAETLQARMALAGARDGELARRQWSGQNGRTGGHRSRLDALLNLGDLAVSASW